MPEFHLWQLENDSQEHSLCFNSVVKLWLSWGNWNCCWTRRQSQTFCMHHNIRLLPLQFTQPQGWNTTIVRYSHLEKWLIVSFSVENSLLKSYLSSSSDTICSAQIGNNLHYSVESSSAAELISFLMNLSLRRMSETKEQCSSLVTGSRGVVFKLANCVLITIDLNQIIQYGSIWLEFNVV